jgi:hypothetical protein
MVVRLPYSLHLNAKISLQTTSRYDRSLATFAEMLAAVEEHLWSAFGMFNVHSQARFDENPGVGILLPSLSST